MVFDTVLACSQYFLIRRFLELEHTYTAREEDDDFLVRVALEEREEKEEPKIWSTSQITLDKTVNSAGLLVLIHVYVKGVRSQ